MTNIGLIIDLPSEQQSEVRISFVLAGRIISKTPVNRNAVYGVLAKVWAHKLNFQLIELETNLYEISFTSEFDMNYVLEQSAWSIDGYLFNLKRWEPTCSLSYIDFSLASFWIQAHGLNLDQLTYNNALIAGRSIGILETAENPVVNNVLRRAFLGFRVQIDFTKPLVAGFWSNGKWIDLKYERLSDYCYKCARLGHSEKLCGEERVMSSVDPNKPMYGDWLKTARMRDEERDYRRVSNVVKSVDGSNLCGACSHALKDREKSQGGGSSYIIPARRKEDLSSDVTPSVPVSPIRV